MGSHPHVVLPKELITDTLAGIYQRPVGLVAWGILFLTS
jgi:hypothetical protein